MCKQSVQIRTSVRVRCMPNRTSEKPGLLKILSERRGEEFRESSTKCFSYRKDCTKQNSVHLVSLRLIWMCHYIWLDHKVWTTVWNDISQVQCKHEPGTAARHSHRRLSDWPALLRLSRSTGSPAWARLKQKGLRLFLRNQTQKDEMTLQWSKEGLLTYFLSFKFQYLG